MKKELTVNFVKKITAKVIIFAIVMFLIATVMQYISPIISNDIAMGQMENSDEAFVTMGLYNRLQNVASALYSIGIAFLVCALGYDTYKFAKIINNEKEN